MQRVRQFLHQNAILCIAAAAAAATSLIIRPDGEYWHYFDWKTLTCLFCVLAVVMALRDIRFFSYLAQAIVVRFRNLGSCTLALVYITFIGSMLIANDMALLTFLPLGFYVLKSTGQERHMAFVFVIQNIAANLGGMLTPFGNPQNLYLYSYYNIPTLEFMGIMLPPFLLSVAMITACCLLFLPRTQLYLCRPEEIALSPRRTSLYLVLFLLAIVIVFRAIPYWIGLIIIPLVLFFADREALAQVDYCLLLTFVAFFVFAGNLGRVPAVSAFLAPLLQKQPLIVSVLSCQFISNVPSAILLSQFTTNYPALLVGVNIGGTGTLVASLASLITYREYVRNNPGEQGRYLKVFAALNLSFLAVLTIFEWFLLK